ncbi:hypothetical protein [Corynebacterium macginleyi]|uniref:Anti-sigma-D factor RsdA sigma factor binding region domain-containing protein n=1 Tax=Corynebacterium macginleyi TaxID=38290 RepID=A0A3M0HH69_9CORY|nr:hypothetical protein [Corynebacterium macginleyi]MBK4142945.1 hypothetical protein [Corynebacterium macginleyi]MBK4143485.1 hypothetical protein [Corynebacterium macginleyi]MBK4146110.1 hypothetical protein [Corynebacterium macginleyi]MBK4147921.1 hypothetical protein [Corynebacterium macginleyi]MBK4153506.1 hypothetical protein [Corynebacterium macginleyi]
MASRHSKKNNDDLTEQLQPLVDDDVFLTELSQGKDPSHGCDELAGLLLGLKGDIDKQMPPAPRVDGVEDEPEIISLDKVRSRRRNRPVMHGLIGAAAATVILAGAGGVMANSGLFDRPDETRNVELASTLDEMESRAAEGDIEGARELMKEARAKLENAESKEENAITAKEEAEKKRSARPKPVTVTATVTETVSSQQQVKPESAPKTVTETQYQTSTVLVTEQAPANPQPEMREPEEAPATSTQVEPGSE